MSVAILTYKRANAHANLCGALRANTTAVPIMRMTHPRVVAQDIRHPETLDVLHSAGDWIAPEWAQFLALHTGIDYIVCYK